ncbi:MAG: hypothetical protein KatS3mg129_2054 [Leptospiraceae bacterium]|nr:MAG: hypothetical protein KatS3mg129_2054 [Leptospiraceae bacterium]
MKFIKIIIIFIIFIIPFLLFSQENSEDNIDSLFEQEIQKETPIEKKNQNNQDFTGRSTQFQFQALNRTWNLDIMAAVDSVMEWDNNTPHNTKNGYYIRTGEFGFYSAIDQLAYGTLTFAAHNENGELLPEVHEANFLFPATIIPRTNIRLGKMFPDVGRLNGFHQHDWHFTTSPIVHKELLSDEGILDTGIELSYLFPWSFWQELSIGIYNGKTFGHAHEEGEIKQNPLLTLHLKHFIPISDYWGTEFGFSYLRWHPDTNPDRWNHQYGIDFYLKYKKGKLKSFIWQTEIWYRETKERPKDRWQYFFDEDNNLKTKIEDYNYQFDPPKKIEVLETKAGLYHFIEYQIAEQWFIGYRYDYFLTPTKQKTNPYTLQKEYQKNGLEENSLIITFKPSEFSYFRGQVSSTIDFETGLRTWQYYLQAVFIIGMHPAHKY